MKTINLITRFACILLMLSSLPVGAENYLIQPGDKLSHIAEKKIAESGLPLNLEQVMLTIYQKNPLVFIDGDINRMVPEKNIYIPDSVEEFLKLSKNEALQKLRDKNFLTELYTTSKKSALAEPSNSIVEVKPVAKPKNFEQIVQTLDNHQQSIDQLKTQNAQLSSNLKLLERAFGRLVLVQGLLTDEVVKVKSSLFKNQPNAVNTVAVENSSRSANASVLTDTAPTILPKVAGVYEKPALPGIPKTTPINQAPSSTTSIFVNQVMEKLELGERPISTKGLSEPIVKSNPNQSDDHYWLTIATYVIIGMAALLLVMILWIMDFRQMRSKFSTSVNR